MTEILERWKKGESSWGCLGTAHCESSGRVVYALPRPNIRLNDLVFPYFKDFDFSLYKESKLPIMMSRGCVAKCTFCSETRFWKKYRYRDASHIFYELQNNIKTYGMNQFAVADSLINGNFQVLSALVNLINESKTQISWNGYARLDSRMNRDLLRRLEKSGCSHLSYGLETGSQKIMDLMEKRTTVAVAKEVIRNTCRAGIQVHLNIIVGFPGENEEDFQCTFGFFEGKY